MGKSSLGTGRGRGGLMAANWKPCCDLAQNPVSFHGGTAQAYSTTQL